MLETNKWIQDIHFVNTENGWALGEDGLSIRTTNGGTNWFEEPSGIKSNINEIYFINKYNGWAVGNNGAILQWGNGVVNSVENKQINSIKLPGEFKLLQNYPNPFNPTTIISYSIPKQSNVKLIIYDALGREVANLVNEEKAAGNYTAEFNAANLSSGIYFYQIRAGEFIQTKKMLLLR